MRASQLPGVESVHHNQKPKTDEHFLKLFGRPVRQLNSDLERSNATSLAQVFEMASGQTLNKLLSKSDNRLSALFESGASDQDVVQTLYWTALTRPPNDIEIEQTTAYLSRAEDRRSAMADLAWALINSKEFMLRR
ncbi:MAG: hypothetical protein ACI8T1_003563 [Verrucomicrobiales bacterium]|jgi:hypothetical protein